MVAKSGTASVSSPDLSSYHQPPSPFTPAPDSSSGANSTTGIALTPKRFVQNPGDASSLAGSENVNDLRRQIDQLAEENRNLTAMVVPPAYSSQ